MGLGKPPLLSLKFAVVFSLSVAAATTTTSSSLSFPKAKTQNLSINSAPKATTKDLISLLGSPQQASTVNAEVAQKFKSCFKFLVPFSPHAASCSVNHSSRRSLRSDKFIVDCGKGANEDERFYNELIWWPPAPVLELARLAVDSGGDPGAIHRTLDPTVIPVPDCEGSKEDKCELTRTPYGWRFVNAELNSYIALLFEIIAARGPSVGLNVSLNRYDLFHGHLFIAVDSGRLGILFHAKEYPAYQKGVFPYNMGFCQRGSNVCYDDSMNLRNILWLAPLPSSSRKEWLAPGVLVVLDAHPDGIIYQDLIPKYVRFARTLYEDDFGEVVVDVNYLNVGAKESKYQLFIC
ncbi:OLC1v1000342C1 [Oldenlandia corymbosa var. corymbosa]|uniref:OLC1v1000342C1 n=1 Tax=Oldenlandia corymbosa var. corymbosa TaxID=529605 RepID=A0AAV1D3L0_OLDCO|nr:OLC1v1000342C1 [Oldenlandia corymbosa var. corymbosa]